MSTSNSTSKNKSKSSPGSAALFFFKWTSTSLDAYTKTVKTNYLKVLVAHCTRARMGDEDGSKSFDFSELGANPRVIKDDREDIRKRLKEAKCRIWTNEEAKPDTPISLVELSALYRLKTLIKMCEKLSELMATMVRWIESNLVKFRKASGLGQILDYVCRMFESVCAIGEVFRLTSVNWASSKYAKVMHPGEDEYKCGEDANLVIGEPEKYCPQLMSQINYFRTLAYIIACSFDGLLETVTLTITPDGVRQRDIKSVLQKLPPQYMFTKDTMKLSTRTANLLKNSPKNELSFPMKSLESLKSEASAKDTSKSLGRKSSKVTSSKYYHARNSEEKTSSLRTETTQDSAKSKSKSKSKSKKKSVKQSLKKLLGPGGNSKKSADD